MANEVRIISYLGNKNVYVIISDLESGAVRYTVHKIALYGLKESFVIGRELPLNFARRFVKKHIKEESRL